MHGGEYAAVPTSPTVAEEQESVAEETASDLQGCVNIFCGHMILSSMLLALPFGAAAHFLEWQPQYVFLWNFIAIVPLAWLIGKSTEDAAAAVGETAGGLLNATFGNVVEMLLCLSGIRQGEIVVVQCTLLGSILSNLLLVMGCAFLAGGIFAREKDTGEGSAHTGSGGCREAAGEGVVSRFEAGTTWVKEQKYNQAGASTQCSLLAMSVFAIGLPTLWTNILQQESEWESMVKVSRWASIFLLGVYLAYLVFQLKTHSHLFQDEGAQEAEDPPDLSAPTATVLLFVCTVITSFATDFLIDAIKGTVDKWNVSREFVGIILLPIIGNAAEHYTAITVAMRNKMDLSLGVAAGSSCQMALLVTPFTVLAGWWMDTEMTLNFHSFQLAVLGLAVFLVATILHNGRSNWLEGYILIITYVVISLIYFFEGADRDSSLAMHD